MRAIDLFSGCGGLSLGFLQNGYEIEKAVEAVPSIARTYQMNFPDTQVIVQDITQIDQSGMFQEGDADVIIGGPPCQGFSMAGARIREGFLGDPRNYLFKHYFNVVKTVKPRVFVMENVRGIMTMQKGEIFEEIKRIFSDPILLDGRGYRLYYRVVNAADFGVPQKRERVILIGTFNERADFDRLWNETKEEIRRECPGFFDPVTVRDAIGNMTSPTQDGDVRGLEPASPYQRYLSSPDGTTKNHVMTRHSGVAVGRMSRVREGENFTALKERIHSVHSGSYGRLCWDEPAATITTRFDTPSGGRFTHPSQDRTLTPREAARLQSFPDSFFFSGNKTSVCKQIGNAVPPKVAFFLARFAGHLLEEL